VRFKGYLNKKLVGESVAEFNYQPNKNDVALARRLAGLLEQLVALADGFQLNVSVPVPWLA
jgi:hypothetical protein